MKNYFTQIQDYLDGLLSQEEQEDFERELSLNEELNKETAIQKRLIEVITARVEADKGLKELKVTLNNNRKQYFSSVTESGLNQSNGNENRVSTNLDTPTDKKVKEFTFKKWGISIAAAACLLIGLNFLGLFSTNLEALPTLQSEITRSNNKQFTLTEAIEHFNSKDYKQSTLLFSDLLKEDSSNVRFQYYLALSYFGEELFEEAASQLESIANGQSLYAQDAAYFYAISTWKLDKNNLAIEYAKKVSSTNSYYKKAQKLIKKLE